jgi:23S rRNA (cytosine1962-C5)-methyltransferase
MNTIILTTSVEKDYELLDSGDGEKLERFGKFVLSRPDPQALWSKNLSPAEWDKADGVFNRGGNDMEDSNDGKGKTSSKNQSSSKGRWKLNGGMPEKWQINFAGLKFFIEPTPFKHVGLFPEQKGNWEWMSNIIKGQTPSLRGGNLSRRVSEEGGEKVYRSEKAAGALEILNLFGYTGGATLACAQAGAGVVHVDGSKVAVTRAKDNAELSGLADKPIRWILDDARDFVKRELRRGNRYDGIIMDPPSFGRGDKGQVWKIEEDFVPFFNDCLKLLSDKPLFFLINGYAAGYSSISYANNLEILKKKFGGTIEAGELTLKEKGGRLLPCGIFARWSAN